MPEKKKIEMYISTWFTKQTIGKNLLVQNFRQIVKSGFAMIFRCINAIPRDCNEF